MTTKPITASLVPEATSGWRIRAFQIAWGLGSVLLLPRICREIRPRGDDPAPLAWRLARLRSESARFSELTITPIRLPALSPVRRWTGSVRKRLCRSAFSFWPSVVCSLACPTATAGYAGRLLQGAGSAFAFTGAVYLATHGFSARWLATAIGVTQCLGMLGGAAGQFVVGPLLEHGVAWQTDLALARHLRASQLVCCCSQSLLANPVRNRRTRPGRRC